MGIPAHLTQIWLQCKNEVEGSAVATAKQAWGVDTVSIEDEVSGLQYLLQNYSRASLEKYLALKDDMTRVNVLRAAFLGVRGGLYADLDYQPLCNWAETVYPKLEAVHREAGLQHAVMLGRWDGYTVCTAVMAATPSCPWFSRVVMRRMFEEQQKSSIGRMLTRLSYALRVNMESGSVFFTRLLQETAEPVPQAATILAKSGLPHGTELLQHAATGTLIVLPPASMLYPHNTNEPGAWGYHAWQSSWLPHSVRSTLNNICLGRWTGMTIVHCILFLFLIGLCIAVIVVICRSIGQQQEPIKTPSENNQPLYGT